MNTTVTVLGAGYVGLTTASLFASSGIKTFLVEPNESRLKSIKNGRSFFFEQGIDPVIQHGLESKNLIPTDSYAESVPESDFIFSCVGTPDRPDGSSNLDFVFSAAKSTIEHMKPSAIYVQKSTVPVGTGEKIIELFRENDHSAEYVSNPEFLREGTALLDTLWFDRVVVGGDNKESAQKVLDLYKHLETKRESISKLADIKTGEENGEYISTSLASAELIKVTSNAFLAMKISFANSIAKVADATGADINEVMYAVGSDKRIGRQFLNAGRGYGGGCFPKDVSGLISSSLENGVDLDIMQAVQDVNDSMPSYIIEKIRAKFNGNLNSKKIAILGLSFKSGTSDVRKSPGIKIANLLSKEEVEISAYDPQAMSEAAEDLDKSITLHESLESTIEGADVVIFTTNWPEFISYPTDKIASLAPNSTIVDAMNSLDSSEVRQHGLAYLGVGKS